MWPRKAEKFIDQFVLGAIVCAGVWYLHRPFLFVYFPSIAPDRGASTIGSHLDVDLALVLFAVAAVCVGALIIHASGFATMVVFRDAQQEGTGRRGRRHFLHRLGRICSWRLWPDPRIRSIERYLVSPRRVPFCAMMSEWSLSSPSALKDPGEALIAHQHLVARLRALSPATRQAVDELHAPVTFGGGLFVALCILVVAAGLSFWTGAMVERVLPVHPNAVKMTIMFGLYGLAVVSALSFQRRFQDFAEQVVTTALHFHQVAQPRHRVSTDLPVDLSIDSSFDPGIAPAHTPVDVGAGSEDARSL